MHAGISVSEMDHTADKVFEHCPRCGSTEFSAIRRDLFVCKSCGFHYHINAAAASGVLFYDGAGRVLFTLRAREPAKGKLGLPGGFVDLGETAEDGLRREIREEIGIESGELNYIGSYPNAYPYKGLTYRTLDLFFEAKWESQQVAIDLDEVDGLVWEDPFTLDSDRIAFDSMRQALSRWKSLHPR